MDNAIILYFEPQKVADWDEAMMDAVRSGLQSYSGKTYEIRLLHVMFHSERPLTEECILILQKSVRDYPELKEEVLERFPNIFD